MFWCFFGIITMIILGIAITTYLDWKQSRPFPSPEAHHPIILPTESREEREYRQGVLADRVRSIIKYMRSAPPEHDPHFSGSKRR
jgi:hypothetical protein